MIKTPVEAVIMKGDGTGGKDEHCLIQTEMRSWEIQGGMAVRKIAVWNPDTVSFLPWVLQGVTVTIPSHYFLPCWFLSSLNRGL